MKFYIISAIDAVARLYVIMIIINAVQSWLRQDIVYRFYGFFRFIAKFVDPFLMQIRRIMPFGAGRIDLSPMIAIFLIEVAKYALFYFVGFIFNG